MISVLICSVNPLFLEQIKKNIQKTIGVPYELFVWDNRQSHYGICKVYNLLAQKAQYSVLCFTHEDILFHTQNWGKNVLKHLENPQIGLIGLLGSQLQPDAPASWWDTTQEFVRQQIMQAYPDRASEIFYHNPDNEVLSSVANIDGLWFCCPKKVWQENRFDEQNFTQFHFYDHDFAVQIAQKYTVGVVYDILVEHFSLGSLNDSWRKNCILFHQKWTKKLPIIRTNIDQEKVKAISFRITCNFTTQLIEQNFDKKTIRSYAFRSLFLNPKDRQTHWFMVWLFQNYFPKSYVFLRKCWRFLKK